MPYLVEACVCASFKSALQEGVRQHPVPFPLPVVLWGDLLETFVDSYQVPGNGTTSTAVCADWLHTWLVT